MNSKTKKYHFVIGGHSEAVGNRSVSRALVFNEDGELEGQERGGAAGRRFFDCRHDGEFDVPDSLIIGTAIRHLSDYGEMEGVSTLGLSGEIEVKVWRYLHTERGTFIVDRKDRVYRLANRPTYNANGVFRGNRNFLQEIQELAKEEAVAILKAIRERQIAKSEERIAKGLAIPGIDC